MIAPDLIFWPELVWHRMVLEHHARLALIAYETGGYVKISPSNGSIYLQGSDGKPVLLTQLFQNLLADGSMEKLRAEFPVLSEDQIAGAIDYLPALMEAI